MKKIMIVLLASSSLLLSQAASAAPTNEASATGVKMGFGFDQGFGVAMQFDNVNAFVGNDGVSADYIIKQGSFGKDVPFNWYVGAGAYYDWGGSDKLGLRVPLGITIPFAKRWDIYGQISPDLDYNFSNDDVNFGISAAMGVRYSF